MAKKRRERSSSRARVRQAAPRPRRARRVVRAPVRKGRRPAKQAAREVLSPALPAPSSGGRDPRRSVPTIVGVGASAGGLEAFSQLIEALPADTQLAIVFVQHLSPQHESALPTLLANKTKIPVVQVTE